VSPSRDPLRSVEARLAEAQAALASLRATSGGPDSARILATEDLVARARGLLGAAKEGAGPDGPADPVATPDSGRDHLAAIVEAAPVAIWSMDVEGRVLSWNRGAENLFGWSAAEIVGHQLPIVGPDDQEQFKALRGEVLAGRPFVGLELRRWRKDGNAVEISFSTAPVTDRQGRIHGILAVATDNGPRKVAEAEARESEQRSRTLFEATPDALFVMDEEGRFLDVNGVAVERYGFRREEFLAMSALDLAGREVPLPVADRLAMARAGPVRFEWCHRRKDGSEFPVEICARPFTLSGRTRIFSSVRDITDRRRAEEKYRSLVENIEDIAFTLDPEGRFGFASNSVTLYGYTPEDLVGRSFGEFVHPEDLPAVQRSFARTMAGRIEPLEFRALDRQGQPRFVRTLSRPVREAGRTTGLTGVLVDLTKQRRMEEQVRSAQKMEAIGRLAGGVAHDFNNLLSVILNCTSFAMEDLAPESAARCDLEEVHRAARRAATLTRQLLAFSRRQVLRPEVLDLAALVADLLKLLRRVIGEDVAIEHAPSPVPCFARLDPGQIEQVLLNLAVNAREAMPDGGTLRIETAAVELTESGMDRPADARPGPHVRLRITDSGRGMPPEVRSVLFEPFFSTKEPGTGAGLGLATVYGIVRQSGGSITVESEIGRGTTFEVWFPAAGSGTPPPPDLPSAAGTSSSLETILLVEDEPGVRDVGRRILATEGYEVLVAPGGAEALRLFREYADRIGLLVTDVVMQGMNGPELAKRLREIRPGLPVLFASGYSDEAVARRGALEPGVDFIGKPFGAEELVRAVRKTLETAPAGRTRPLPVEALPGSRPPEEAFEPRATGGRDLPAGLRGQIRAGALAADYDGLLVSIEECRAVDPALADRLRGLHREFDYDGILAACESTPEATGDHSMRN
jgi:PAS domain S-box-containing protein